LSIIPRQVALLIVALAATEGDELLKGKRPQMGRARIGSYNL
jgi:hypothetical protein